MPVSTVNRQRALFALMCLIWGTNWIALKAGAMAVPPALFSGTRWTAAGLILLVWAWSHGHPPWLGRRLAKRTLLVAFLMVTINAIVLLYGLRYVGSGLAAVINSALTPISLLGFSIAMGQERFSPRQAVATAIGITGVLLLFGPRALAGNLGLPEVLGALGVIGSTVAYSAGSVLARPLMRRLPPARMAAMTNFLGGVMLLIFSAVFERDAGHAATSLWGWPATLSWLFLLFAGSLGGTIIYFRLVRDWGASRTGTYAFICPVIALASGMIVFGETIDLPETFGIALMLVAAVLVLRR